MQFFYNFSTITKVKVKIGGSLFFFSKRHEITVEDGCLLWEIRVIIPSQPRERVLYELHTGHPGIVPMKSLARLHVWWPNLDRDIATIVRKCDNCQKSRNKPQPAPLHPWDWQKCLGRECTSILQVHSWVKCF